VTRAPARRSWREIPLETGRLDHYARPRLLRREISILIRGVYRTRLLLSIPSLSLSVARNINRTDAIHRSVAPRRCATQRGKLTRVTFNSPNLSGGRPMPNVSSVGRSRLRRFPMCLKLRNVAKEAKANVISIRDVYCAAPDDVAQRRNSRTRDLLATRWIIRENDSGRFVLVLRSRKTSSPFSARAAIVSDARARFPST